MFRTDYLPTNQLHCSVSSDISYDSYCSIQLIIITAVQKHKSRWFMKCSAFNNGSSVSHCQNVVIQLCQSGNSIHKTTVEQTYSWICQLQVMRKKAQHSLLALLMIIIIINNHWNSMAAHVRRQFFNMVENKVTLVSNIQLSTSLLNNLSSACLQNSITFGWLGVREIFKNPIAISVDKWT